MTREEFKQHCISALSELGIEHPEDILFVVEPYIEPDKPHQTFDEIMRLQVLPKARKMPFDQVINILTMWEGYFPCRIDISRQEDDIVLKTYLRIRKVPKKDNNDIFPFRIVDDHTMKLKNIYRVRLLNPDAMSVIPKDKIGKPTWLVLLQKDVSWSAYAVVPDTTVADQFDLDIIFDKDFRSTTEVNIGDIFDIAFDVVDKRLGTQKVEVIGIRMDRPINHLENKDR